MHGIVFCEEFIKQGRKRVSEGNVVAVIVANGTFRSSGTLCYEAISAVYYQENSPVAGTAVALAYLQERCKVVTEERARQIHPNLFAYLDAAEEAGLGSSA